MFNVIIEKQRIITVHSEQKQHITDFSEADI